MLFAFRGAACAIVLLSVAAGGEPQEQVSNALAPVGPLAHWKGDDGEAPKSAVDSSGNGFNGAYSAGATKSATVAAVKFPNTGSINLDGMTGMVTVPDSPSLRITGDFTVSFWKRKTANAKDWTRMVGKGNGAQRNFGVWEAPEGDGRILFQMYGPGGQSVIDLWSNGATPLNTWTHVLCTVSVNAVAMYLNGQPAGNGIRSGEPGTAPDPLTFGHAGYHGFWPGQLDDIRIYNRALSMSEVAYLAAGNGPPVAPTALASTAASAQTVSVTWTASTTPAPAGTVTYYVLKRSTAQGKDYAAVASMLSGTTCIDPKVEPGKTYFYVVTALNTGGESIASNECTVATPAK
jgi:concanavalin A-like lectin/glucanase superfamily protein/fibronectin type III domain protein